MYKPRLRLNALVVCGNTLDHCRPESPDGSQFEPTPLSITGRSTGMQQKHTASRRPFESVSTRMDRVDDSPRVIRRAYTAQSDTFRSEDMGIPPLRYAVQTGSDVSLGSSVPPDCSRGPNTDHAMRHIFGDRFLSRNRSRQPPTVSPRQLDTFRLILPEDIAIGIRFSHASRTSSHSWHIAQ